MATKKRSTKRKVSSKKSGEEMKSFQVAKQPKPFMVFKFTRQTAYWLVILAVIVLMQIWILKLQFDISGLIEALGE